VYVFATYGEYGLEERVATVDRASMPALLERFMDDGFRTQNRIEAVEGLAGLLCKSDEEISKSRHDLMTGWGGIQLYVIKLQ
jgi:hypothetical protein